MISNKPDHHENNLRHRFLGHESSLRLTTQTFMPSTSRRHLPAPLCSSRRWRFEFREPFLELLAQHIQPSKYPFELGAVLLHLVCHLSHILGILQQHLPLEVIDLLSVGFSGFLESVLELKNSLAESCDFLLFPRI